MQLKQAQALKRLATLLSAGAAVGVSIYTYASYMTLKNRTQLSKHIKQSLQKPASNNMMVPQSKIAISDKMQTGDMILIKYEYAYALTPRQYLYGLLDSKLHFYSQVDAVGFICRKDNNSYVLYNQFGETKVREMRQFLLLPYIVELFEQKNVNKNSEIENKILEMVQQQLRVKINQNPVQMINRISTFLYGKKAQLVVDVREHLSTQNINLLVERSRRQKELKSRSR